MNKKLNIDDFQEGMLIPELEKKPTTQQLVMWAGASGDFNPIHYDQDFAKKMGLPNVIVHGQLILAFLGQMITDWLGETGELKRLSVNYKGMNLPGDTILCQGVVKGKNPNSQLVTLDVWSENPQGEKTVTGTAVVHLTN